VFSTSLIGIGKGKAAFTYNLLDLQRTTWTGGALGAGKHTIVFDFKYNGPGPGKGGTGVLSVDGKAGEPKELKHTVPLFFTISETFDIGDDLRTGVNDLAYQLPFAFTGTIDTLKVGLGPSQLSEPDKQAAAAAIAKAND